MLGLWAVACSCAPVRFRRVGSASSATLFVDDDPDLLEVLREALSFMDHGNCICAGSLAQVKEQRAAVLGCQLAVVDINLGYNQPSGLDVVDWLRGEGFRGQIVFLTGHAADDPRVVAAVNVSGAELVSKPLELDELECLIDRAQVHA